ncbi:3-methyl-2-oxobutanoate hydroxymethyltransferase [Macrococcoides canis]|uniref:3-methyl-2-oxobutanoate hydroxymethyltransferase n=1 Tax=Macrococcoides canis TaxID=1855823 RepID=UPI001AEC5ACB|nr:3-methyl-2-oxobutanoate hydroxymethyltransferase [Macrococcus canis]QTQ09211.1 3-methyl-2-oxobutanoate hydroxymethyltransferase [Macrococcus canis]
MRTTQDLLKMKQLGEKITMMTAYDYPSAKQVEAAQIDTILVGDSLGMTVLGYESTVQVTLSDMIHHARAARRGAPNTFIVADMPIGSVGISETQDLNNALRLYQESGANAIKAEGAHLGGFIKRCKQIGIPVVSHLGLTPQSVGIMGYSVQAKTKDEAKQLIQDCMDMEAAGAIMIVLEVIPSDLAEAISKKVNIPVIGIGAGSGTDGQVLVYHDVLQYGQEHRAKFVKVFGDFTTGVDALRRFNEEVKTGQFPSEAYTYKAKVMEDVIND